VFPPYSELLRCFISTSRRMAVSNDRPYRD
jgi:hypothetical protein